MLFLGGFLFQSGSHRTALRVARASRDGICDVFQTSSAERQVCLRLFLQSSKVLVYKDDEVIT